MGKTMLRRYRLVCGDGEKTLKCCFCNKPTTGELKAIINGIMHYFCNMEHLNHYRKNCNKLSVLRRRIINMQSQFKLAAKPSNFRVGQLTMIDTVLKMMNYE